MGITQRKVSVQTLTQILLDEPLPQSNSKEHMTDYVRRLMSKLSGGNIFRAIKNEDFTQITQLNAENALGRVQVVAVLEDRFLCKILDGAITATSLASPTYVKSLKDINTLVRSDLKGYFKLVNDIDTTGLFESGGEFYNSGYGWDPIGDKTGGEHGTTTDCGFQGIFDGNGFTIKGLTVNRPTEDYVGLFGFMGDGGVVKNLTLDNISISGKACVGGLVGGNNGTISNCHTINSNEIQGNCGSLDYTGNAGGLVGDNDGIISGCTTTGVVHGLRDVGGLSGDNDKIIIDSSSSADVYGSQISDIGGLCGDNKGFYDNVAMADVPIDKSVIFNCFATGNVYSEDTAPGSPAAAGDIGGLVGDNRGSTISWSYATGDVEGVQKDIGGFVGSNALADNLLGEYKDSIINNCYCTGNVTPVGDYASGDNPEGECGGFVGDNKGGQIYNCYCANSIILTEGDREDKGDFCGDNQNSTEIGKIVNSYYDSTLGTIDTSDGGTGITTANMLKQASYVTWDFTNIWEIEEDVSYPTLKTPNEYPDNMLIYVYPVYHTGSLSLRGDVRPKMFPGSRMLAIKSATGIYYAPNIYQDLNFPVTKTDLSDRAGNDILGTGLEWDADEKISLSGESGGIDFTDSVDEITVGFDNPVAYSASMTYSTDMKVSSGGVNYKSLVDNNTNHTPASSPTYWESFEGKVLLINNRLPGDGLQWSATNKLEIYQGNGLDIDENGALCVDVAEAVDCSSTTINADGTAVADNNWNTVLTKAVTAAVGRNLDIRLYLPCIVDDVGIGDARGKFSMRILIDTSAEAQATIIEGKYELPDHGNQVPVVASVIRENITYANPNVYIQLRNDDYTINQVHYDCADRDGQFTVIAF